MKVRQIAGLASLLSILSMPALAAAQAKTVKFVTDPEKENGFLLAITKAAFEKMGYTVQVQFMPWARGLAAVMSGEAEALLGAQYTDERAARMLYSDVIGRSEMVFFKLKETKVTFRKLEDLKGLTIGTIVQSTYTPEFDGAPYLKKEAVTDYVTNVKKLLMRRIPLFLEKKYVVLNTLRTQFPAEADTVDYLPAPLKELKFYDCFSKAVPGYEQKAKDFDAGLAQIVKDGTYQAIMNKGMHE